MGRLTPFSAGLFGANRGLALADQPTLVQTRRPRYRPTVYSPAWIDPAWRSRRVLESADEIRRLQGAQTWIYQLQNIDPAQIAASEADVAVIDLTPNGEGTDPFSAQQVESMRRKTGGRKKIISYMSIGEAEEGRFYWRKEWMAERNGGKRRTRSCPRWIYGEDAEWSSYKVNYWDPDWQNIILGEGDSYLGQILKAGFDGVYLDIINGYQEFADKGDKDAATRMIQFVVAIAKAARKHNPDFLVVPQNGEQLLVDDTYRAFISAIGKEDILYNNPRKANDEDSFVTRNAAKDSWDVEGYLQHAKRCDIPVLSVEYLHSVKPKNVEAIPATAEEVRKLGYIPYFGNRLLNKLYDPVMPPVAMS